MLKLKPLFGQLMDKSLWFTHWPAIQNVSGQPSIALPVHVTEAGLPLGIQAAGRPGDEETLLSLAAQMEKISGWLTRRAPLLVPADDDRESRRNDDSNAISVIVIPQDAVCGLCPNSR